MNTRNPSYSKLVFYFQQISPIIIIWEWFSSVIHSSIKIIKILYSVSTCQPMCSQSQFVFYFEPKTPKPLWFKMMNWQPLAVLHHGILWTLHNIKILIFTGTNRNREPVLSSFGWEKFLVHIQNRLEQCSDTCQTMVLNVHPKKYSFIDLVSIKDDNMAFHFTLDWHPLGQNFMFFFAKAQSALSSPYQFLIPRTVNRNRNRTWRADSYDGISVKCVTLRSSTSYRYSFLSECN